MAPKTKTDLQTAIQSAPMLALVPQCPPAFGAEWAAIAPLVRSAPVQEEWMLVTPDLAKHWLATRNTGNRPIRDTRVSAITRDIRSGSYQQTHQGVAFDVDGVLCDGQHRLSAIVASGVPLMLRVTFGLSKDAFKGIDFGISPRRSSDDFARRGKTHYRNRASIARAIVLLETRERKYISHAQIDSTEGRFLDAIEWAIPLSAHKKAGILIAHAAAFAYAYTVRPADVSELASQTVSMVGLQENTPAYLLARSARSPQMKTDESGRTRPLQGDEASIAIMLKTLRACKAHIVGEKLGRLYDNSEGFDFFKSERLRLGLD